VFEEEKINKENKKKGIVAPPTENISGTMKATDANNDDNEDFDQASLVMSAEEKQAQTLAAKIENILPRIYIK